MPASIEMIRLGSGWLAASLPAELNMRASALAAALTRPSAPPRPCSASSSPPVERALRPLPPDPCCRSAAAASSLKLRVLLVRPSRLLALLRRLEGCELVLCGLRGLLALLQPLPWRP
jgi:hypothetical protein